MVSHTKVHRSGNLVLTISGEVPTLPNPLSLLIRNLDDTSDVVKANMDSSERIIMTLTT